MSRRRAVRSGVTLIELMVVLAILGVLAGVATLATPWSPPISATPTLAAVSRARSAALVTRQAVTTTIQIDGRPGVLTAFPDGSVIGDSALQVNPLTGVPSDAPNGQPNSRETRNVH